MVANFSCSFFFNIPDIYPRFIEGSGKLASGMRSSMSPKGASWRDRLPSRKLGRGIRSRSFSNIVRRPSLNESGCGKRHKVSLRCSPA